MVLWIMGDVIIQWKKWIQQSIISCSDFVAPLGSSKGLCCKRSAFAISRIVFLAIMHATPSDVLRKGLWLLHWSRPRETGQDVGSEKGSIVPRALQLGLSPDRLLVVRLVHNFNHRGSAQGEGEDRERISTFHASRVLSLDLSKECLFDGVAVPVCGQWVLHTRSGVVALA